MSRIKRAKQIGLIITFFVLMIILYGMYDIFRPYPGETGGTPMHLKDRCPASTDIKPGPSDSPWYHTIAPCEAFNSERTHTFPYTCSADQLVDLSRARVRHRTLKGLPWLYNIVTRNPDELFVLGGFGSTEGCETDGPDCATGPYVAKINANTMTLEWKHQFHNAKANKDWDYPGAIGVHGNGYVYAVNGYHLVKFDPDTGGILNKVKLPTAGNQPPGDTIYNGFSILSDGNLVLKSITRKKGATADTINALLFHVDHDVPAFITVVEPDKLDIVTRLRVKEPVLGRITNGKYKGRDYIYVGGFNNLFRYIYEDEKLRLDEDWGPVLYAPQGQKPGTAPAFFGDFVLIQTNFQIAKGPLLLTAVSHEDDEKIFRISPFKTDRLLPGSLQFSLPTVDVENMRVYACDVFENRLAALDFDPETGFSIAWKVKQRSLSFGAIMGPKENRTFVLDDANLPTLTSSNLVWRDAKTGKELLRSDRLPQAHGMPATPGFNGVLYFTSAPSGTLIELSLTADD